MNGIPLLTILTVLPIAGGIVVLSLGPDPARRARWVTLACSGLTLTLVLGLWSLLSPGTGALHFEERYPWIPSLGVEYRLGVDGLSMVLLLLTALLVPMSVLASWNVEGRVPLYFGLILFLQAGLIGTFTALNFFHWFLFWELSLLPAFFLVRLWGGTRRAEAAAQFFIYTMVGSVAMLLGFIALFLAAGTFDFFALAQAGRSGSIASALGVKFAWAGGAVSERHWAAIVCAAVFLGFAVKVPVVPFHGWLPLTYTEAPLGVTMLLTGLMSKMGVYGLLRIVLPIFPEQLKAMLTVLLWLAVATIVFSAAVAFSQRDLRALLAYSSINHLGYCVLGSLAALAPTPDPTLTIERTAALNGVVLQVFNHGLTAATLFWMLSLLEQRTHGDRDIHDFGGLRTVTPVFAGLAGVALFSSLGLPGLNGFVSEFLIFKGVFPLVPWAAALSLPGLMITAVFLLTVMQRVFHGPLNERWTHMADLSARERVFLGVPVGMMLLLGIHPQVLIGTFNHTMTRLVEQFGH